jgi:hypothetical protein
MSKFSSLAADVSKPFRVELLDPATDEVIRDHAGVAAFIDVYSIDSERGRAFDRQQRKDLRQRVMQSRNGRVEPNDQLEENMSKCAALTDAWHLVDPATREVLDEPCTAENAADLYAEPGTGWIFTLAWIGAISIANFMPRRSTNSAGMQNLSSATSAS